MCLLNAYPPRAAAWAVSSDKELCSMPFDDCSFHPVAERAGVAAGPRRGGAAVARQGRALRQHAHAHRERDSGSVCRCGADGSRAASSAPCTMMSCAGVCGEFVFGDYAYLQQRCSDLRRNDAVCDLNVAAISGEDEEDSSLPHLPTHTHPRTRELCCLL